jgi:hypothetical protein
LAIKVGKSKIWFQEFYSLCSREPVGENDFMERNIEKEIAHWCGVISKTLF